MAHVTEQHVAEWWVAGWHPPMLDRTLHMYYEKTEAQQDAIADEYHNYFGTGKWGGAPAWGEDADFVGTLDWWGRPVVDEYDPRVVDDDDGDPPDGRAEIVKHIDVEFLGHRVRIWTQGLMVKLQAGSQSVIMMLPDINSLVLFIAEAKSKIAKAPGWFS